MLATRTRHTPAHPVRGWPPYTAQHGVLCTFPCRFHQRGPAALPPVRPEQPVRHHRRPSPGKLLVHGRRYRSRRAGRHSRSPAPPVLPVPALRRRAVPGESPGDHDHDHGHGTAQLSRKSPRSVLGTCAQGLARMPAATHVAQEVATALSIGASSHSSAPSIKKSTRSVLFFMGLSVCR